MGYVFAIAQAVLYSTMGIVCKVMLNTGMSTQQVMLLRFLFTAVLLAVFLLIWRRQPLFSNNPLTYAAGGLFFCSAYFYYVGVDLLTAGMATVIYFVFPAVVAVLGVFVFHERFTPRLAVVLFLIIAGIFFISEVYLPGKAVLDPLGIAVTVFACCCFAGYTVLTQWVGTHAKPRNDGRQEGAFTLIFDVTIVCLAMSAAIFSDQVPTILTLQAFQLGCGAFMAVFNTILPLVLLTIAINAISATKTTLIGTCETPCSLLLAWAILGEVITPGQAVGSSLIIVAVVLVALGSKAKPRKEEGQ